MTADQHTLQRRIHAAALADCPGWTQWALPELLTLITHLEQSILTDESLPVDELQRHRAKFRALTDFLQGLHDKAANACDAPLPSIPGSVHLAPEERQKILDAFTRQDISPLQAQLPPPPPSSDVATNYSPFDGIPQPVRKSPPPAPPKEEPQP